MHHDQTDGRGQTDGFGQTRLSRPRLIDPGDVPALPFPRQDYSCASRLARTIGHTRLRARLLPVRQICQSMKPWLGGQSPATPLISRAGGAAAAPSTLDASNNWIGAPGITVLIACL